MILEESIQQRGDVEIIIEHDDGSKEVQWRRNCILQTAKKAQANALANNLSGSGYEYYIDSMIFGVNGTLGGAPKVVESSRNGLFGVTILNKSVTSTVNPQLLTQAIFTAVVGKDEANGNVINEMALVMKNGDLYSMVTLGGISKTSSMQIIFNWRISVI